MELEIWNMEAENVSDFHRFFLELSPQLKRCFSNCAVFPRNAVINVDQLIRLWAAEDLLKDSVHKDKVTSCKMEDVVHIHARYIARNHLPWLRGFKIHGPSVLENKLGSSFLNISAHQAPMEDLFKYLKYVKALISVYVTLSRAFLERLQTFRDILGLIIRQMSYKLCPKSSKRLTSIRTLDVFRAGGRYNDVEKIKELNYLEEIRISIHGEVNLLEANLERKVKMENLELCFLGDGRDPEKSKSIEELQPPPNLKMLKLEDYLGSCQSGFWNPKTIGSGVRIEDNDDPEEEEEEEEIIESTEHEEISDASDQDEKISDQLQSRCRRKYAGFPKLKTLRVEYLEHW
ncbi:OLC1v1007954C1 [Oldenlandia corymbosa var. corymbosa]|uniref:OLC1v1007954C1 n=1 Tax=Oldenlandia corymbosa var. corymbosa TaxID=529605 RepID=A0AAV1DMX4_OLDCO|nr:OLC1v1007954C1 [Oldenlandia corymbosa var. corymbosa]